MRTVYLNGQFLPEAEAKLSIYDLSVMQSAAAFEMTRSFNGVHFKLHEHIERLERSCQLLSIPLPNHDGYGFFADYVASMCHDLADRHDHGPGEEHRLLIVVSPGCAPMYKDLEGVIPHPFLYIADFPLRYTVKGFSKYFTEGVHCVTSKIRQVPDACVPSAAKHRSRLHFHLAQMQAPEGTWPLMLDEHGKLVEGPGCNIMTVSQGQVRFHAENALPGISMHTIADMTEAKEARMWPWVHELPRNEQEAPIDELWLTGTPFCMLPVVSLDGKPIGTGKPGPIYQQTLAMWSEMVGVDIKQQVIAWDSQG